MFPFNRQYFSGTKRRKKIINENFYKIKPAVAYLKPCKKSKMVYFCEST